MTTTAPTADDRPAFIHLDPCLPADDADRLYAVVRRAAPFSMYVEAPIAEGLGAGLVRRHDALMNYVTGTYARGAGEPLDVVAARTNLFRHVLAEGRAVHDADAAALLYRHPPFIAAARALAGRDHVVPDMLYANVLLPGQELAVHTDTPEYRGLSKAQVPEWLLVVMHHSGLFEDWRVHIAGGVTFLNPPRAGGAFVLYPDGPDGEPVALPPAHDTSVMLDADALFHAVERVGGPDTPAPPVAPGMTLHAEGAAGWVVRDGDTEVARYGPGDVRVSLQWKAHCFADAAEAQRFADHTDDLSVDDVVARLTADLEARGRLDGPLDDTALALRLIETYVRFPDAAC